MLYTAGNLPLVVWMIKGFIETIPKELDESARLDGCTTFQIFIRIIVPLCQPGLMAASIVVFVNTWNEFIMASTFIQSSEKRMLQVGIRLLSGYYEVEWTNIMAICLLGSIPPIIIFLLFQRTLIAGMTRGAIKG